MRRGISVWLKVGVAYIVCTPALVMPYHMRITYIRGISALLHAPFVFFGSIAHFLLNQLHIEPLAEPLPEQKAIPGTDNTKHGRVAVLYSGGTDSTCAAALIAERAREIHLLTFCEYATRQSPAPTKNIERLQKRFPSVVFVQKTISVDRLVRHFWYERYFFLASRYGYLVLATPGFSSLSWHVRMIVYCRENGIDHVVDGLTRELMQFPGHMDAVVRLWRGLYREFGITYENPVREWPTPPDRQFMDQVLVNRHQAFLFGVGDVESRTTGRYLYDIGVFPTPNMKGSRDDFKMQHDCYPFSLYNILAFWGHLSIEPYGLFEQKIAALMSDKVHAAKLLLEKRFSGNENNILTSLIAEAA